MIGVARLLVARAHELRGLEPVHAGHRDVEDDQREVLLEQAAERLDSGVREHELAAERRERGLDRDEVGLVVVDDEDVPAIADRQRIILVLLEREQLGAGRGGPDLVHGPHRGSIR